MIRQIHLINQPLRAREHLGGFRGGKEVFDYQIAVLSLSQHRDIIGILVCENEVMSAGGTDGGRGTDPSSLKVRT